MSVWHCLFVLFFINSFCCVAQSSDLDKTFRVPANFRESQTQLDSLLRVLGKITNLDDQVFLRVRIGNLYRQQDLKKATEFVNQTLDLAKKVKSKRALAFAYEQASDFVSLAGDHPLGAKYIDLAIHALERERDSLSIAKRLLLLSKEGGWLAPLTAIEKKIGYMLQSLKLYKRLGNKEELAWAYFELGMQYRNRALYYSRGSQSLDEQDAKLALEHFAMAEVYNRTLNKKVDVAFSLSMQATMEKFLGNFTKAYQLNLRAITIYIREGCKLGPAFVYSEMADILFHQQHYDSALFFVDKSIIASKEVGYMAGLWEFNDTKTKIYEAKRDYRHALESNRQARIERDKLYNADQLKLIANIQNSYENQLKDERIKELEAEKKLQESIARQQRIVVISAFSIFAIVIGLGSYAYYQRQKSINQMKENIKLGGLLQRNLEDKLQDTQLAALKAQMDPHFIGNAINSIQNLILQEKKEDALIYLNDFSKLTRCALENSKKETITLNEETEFLKHYVHLEQLRYPGKFDFKITIDPSIDDPTFERIPPMMIQPFVENAIRHGIHHKESKGFIKVFFYMGESSLMCTIEDNGVGREAATTLDQHQRKSHSTAITDARLELLQKKADFQHNKIQIEDLYKDEKATGTKVIIIIPTFAPPIKTA